MATAADIIDQAFIDLGVIQPGEAITAAMLANAFAVINQLLSSWSAEDLMAFNWYQQVLTLTAGTSAYTFGAAGSLVSTARPVRIINWKSSISTNFANGGAVISFEEFRTKNQNPTGRRSVLAEMVAADQNYPALNIEVFPTPDTSPGSLTLGYWGSITAFAATSTTVTLPDGYEEALHSNLAIALAPQYARVGGVTPELAALAQNSKAAIITKNAAILGKQQQQAA